jgi:hypothetical protein
MGQVKISSNFGHNPPDRVLSLPFPSQSSILVFCSALDSTQTPTQAMEVFPGTCSSNRGLFISKHRFYFFHLFVLFLHLFQLSLSQTYHKLIPHLSYVINHQSQNGVRFDEDTSLGPVSLVLRTGQSFVSPLVTLREQTVLTEVLSWGERLGQDLRTRDSLGVLTGVESTEDGTLLHQVVIG